jgi:phage terminase Nu1 subunit (DNA packaging protein)
VLTELVSGIAAQVGVIFDALPGKIKRESPDLPANALDTIARELAKGRNAIASMKIDDVLRDETPSINDLPITEIT